MKEKVKNIAIILIGIISVTSLTVSATTLMKSKDVIYDNSKSGITSTNVQEAVDELYSAATDYSDHERRLQALESSSFLNAHPIGSIYLTISEEENTVTKMHNLYGGTWESYGQGRTLVGVGTGTDSNGTVKVFNKNESSGEYSHMLTVDEMPSHAHIEQFPINGISGIGYPSISSSTTSETFISSYYQFPEAPVEEYYRIITKYAGGSQSHNNIQPYTTVYMYKRVN